LKEDVMTAPNTSGYPYAYTALTDHVRSCVNADPSLNGLGVSEITRRIRLDLPCGLQDDLILNLLRRALNEVNEEGVPHAPAIPTDPLPNMTAAEAEIANTWRERYGHNPEGGWDDLARLVFESGRSRLDAIDDDGAE
jgi:hypothetical protein